MNRLRNRLILVFAVATLAPLLITVWISLSLLDRSLSLASTRELDQVSKSLEKAGRELYQRARDSLKEEANSGRLAPQPFTPEKHDQWPAAVREFFASNDAESF